MSRHEVRNLAPGVVVVVGWDRGLGFWVEIRRPGEPHPVCDATTEDGATSIAGVFNTLIEADVVAHEDVADAEMWLVDADVNDIPDVHAGLRVAAEVIVHLRAASGGS